MTNTTTSAIQVNRARRAVAKERLWIKEHGGSETEYVARYGSMDDTMHYGDGGEAIWAADVAALVRAESHLAKLQCREPRSVEDILAAPIIEASDLSTIPDPAGNFTAFYDGVPVGLLFREMGYGSDETKAWRPQPYDGTRIVSYEGATQGFALAVEAMAAHLSNVGSEAYFSLLRERHNASERLRDASATQRTARESLYSIDQLIRSAAKPA